MTYRMYPDEKTVGEYIARKEPLIIAIPFDYERGEVLMSLLDDSFEHHILLAHFDIKQTNIDRYFRVVADDESAEWTFVCPKDYAGINDRQRRITRFYNDGITAISRVLADIGYFSDIKIPKRYRRQDGAWCSLPKSAAGRCATGANRRHFEALGDDSTFLPY